MNTFYFDLTDTFDHKQHAQDLFKRAMICTDKELRNKLMDTAKEHLQTYHELTKDSN